MSSKIGEPGSTCQMLFAVVLIASAVAVPATLNPLTNIDYGMVSITLNCSGTAYNYGSAFYVLRTAQPSALYEILLATTGAMGRLTNADYKLAVTSKTTTTLNISTSNLGNGCSTTGDHYRLGIVLVPSKINLQFIIANNLQVGISGGMYVLPRATTSLNPTVYAFITSVVSGPSATYAVSASLPNATSVSLTVASFQNCKVIYVGCLVVESSDSTTACLYIQFGMIAMLNGTLNLPSYDPKWTNIFLGMISFTPPSDLQWNCSMGSLRCLPMI